MASSNKQFKSNKLNEFLNAYLKAGKERDLLWNNITTPFIENILDDEKNNLVTFLYRKSTSDTNSSIFVDCNAVGLPLTKDSQMQSIPGTDLFYLTLKLPNQLRTAYTFLTLDNKTDIAETKNVAHQLHPFPEFAGSLKKIVDTVMRLHAEGKVEIDPRNSKKMSYYEYHDPTKCFFTESILELPNAPLQAGYLSDANVIKSERNKLAQEKRFHEYSVLFSKTCLKDLPYYQDKVVDSKDEPSQTKRNYWVYLPPDYDSQKVYPLYLFLDGSDYLNTLPIPSMLERMIHDKELQPCIAVFIEYAPHRRSLEYYGDEPFTRFLATDFMRILREEHHLPVTKDPALTTIVGLSASGLAAIFAGLTRPEVFGNVITQSAALWSRKWSDIEKWVDAYLLKKADTIFCMEAGSYENYPTECRFEDGSTQATSILETNKALNAYLIKKGVKARFHEFVGGHNYLCYRFISERLKEVHEMRLEAMGDLTKKTMTKP